MQLPGNAKVSRIGWIKKFDNPQALYKFTDLYLNSTLVTMVAIGVTGNITTSVAR
jgi:hypothetical protein